jgi:hypothetical protein
VSGKLTILEMQMSFIRFVERFVLRRRPVSQPTPDVTPDDVERVVRRDFPSDQVPNVTALLNERKTGSLEYGPRVQLAALKLANGSLEQLRACLETATRDYRDVLVPAEYPEYSRIVFRLHQKMSITEHNRVIKSDWRQYEEWLRR